MPLTQEQTIKAENWKAQHNSLLGCIKVANEELESILNQQSDIEKKRKESLIKLHEKKLEIKKIIEDKENIIYSINLKISELKKEVPKIQKRIDFKNKSLNKIEIKEKKSEQRRAFIVIDIVEKKIELSFVTGLVKDTNSILSDIKSRLELRKQEEKKLDKSISELVQKCHNNEMKFKKEYSSQTKILKSIKQEIKEEKDKIKSPRMLLKMEERGLAKKERNLNTLIRRFKIYYSKEFPDRELNI